MLEKIESSPKLAVERKEQRDKNKQRVSEIVNSAQQANSRVLQIQLNQHFGPVAKCPLHL